MAYHLWGFLNVNLMDGAWEMLGGVEVENSFPLSTPVSMLTSLRPHLVKNGRLFWPCWTALLRAHIAQL